MGKLMLIREGQHGLVGMTKNQAHRSILVNGLLRGVIILGQTPLPSEFVVPGILLMSTPTPGSY